MVYGPYYTSVVAEGGDVEAVPLGGFKVRIGGVYYAVGA